MRTLSALCVFNGRVLMVDPLQMFARQPMKHREMGPKKVSLRREMFAPEAVERFEVALVKACSQDEGQAGFQSRLPSCRPVNHRA